MHSAGCSARGHLSHLTQPSRSSIHPVVINDGGKKNNKKKTGRKSCALFFGSALIPLTQLEAAAPPQDSSVLKVRLKGASLAVMREGQALLFNFFTQIYQ